MPSETPRDADRWQAYERTTVVPCSHVVVSAVADVMGCTPLDLEPLYNRIDPDALDTLVDESLDKPSTPKAMGFERDTSVRFDFAGCEVVAGSTAVNVAPLQLSLD